MKINEIVNTSIMKQGWKKQDHRDGLDLKAMANEEGLSILAYDAGGREIGFVHFEIIDDKLESFDTWVDPRMRRQGIATVMYNYAKELGNELAPSTAQTADGKKFWKSIKKQPVAEGSHKLDNVVTDLEQDLENPHSYDAIDHMMQTIAREHDITAKQLHDMFVAKHGQVPDEWVNELEENFADGKNPQDKGDSRRHGIPKHATLAQLDKIAKEGGRRGQLAHWQANMRRGRK